MFWQEYQMLGPAQNQQALVHWYDDLSANFVVLDLGEEPYENDNKQCHEEFDRGMSAIWSNNNITFMSNNIITQIH